MRKKSTVSHRNVYYGFEVWAILDTNVSLPHRQACKVISDLLLRTHHLIHSAFFCNIMKNENGQ